jgi:hypothetical protein
MKRINLRTLIIGLAISLAVEFLIPLIHTAVDFIVRTNLRYPLTHYLLWGYLPVLLSGIYVGLSGTDNKITNGIIVGIFYYVIFVLIVGATTGRHLWGSTYSFGFALLSRGFICATLAWCTSRIKAWAKNMKIGGK